MRESLTGAVLLAILSFASTCGLNETQICIDGKRFYTCTDVDKNLFGHQDAMDHYLLLEKVQSHIERHVELPVCDGHCTTFGCNDQHYQPLHNECECNELGYVCTTLHTYKYCVNGTSFGDQHIECPENEVCSYHGPQKSHSPCVTKAVADHSLSMHCYYPINGSDAVVSDYSDFCRLHGSGLWLPPDLPICDYYIYTVNLRVRPTFASNTVLLITVSI